MSVFTKITISSPKVTVNKDICTVAKISAQTMKACSQAPGNSNSAVELMHKMTGEPLEVCELFIGNKTPIKTFSEWYREYDMEQSDTNGEPTHDVKIRGLIIHHYIHLRSLPTVESMQRCLEENYGITYNADEMNKLLKMNGYHWKPLNGTSKSILLEDSKKCYERRKYLDRIMELRQSKRHFVYIDDTIVRVDRDSTSADAQTEILYSYTAVSPSLGLLNSAHYTIRSNLPRNEIKVPTESFIIDKVIYEIPPSSVIVLPERSYHEKPFLVLPDMHSTRTQMREWLSYHDVPHTGSMYTAELFELVQRTKRNFQPELRKFDATLSIYGHTVLRLPRKTSCLYYFEPFWADFEKSCSGETGAWKDLVLEALKQVSNKTWIEMENDLIAMEKKISNEDEAVENVNDKILTMARDKALTHQDLADCDDIASDEWLREVIFP